MEPQTEIINPDKHHIGIEGLDETHQLERAFGIFLIVLIITYHTLLPIGAGTSFAINYDLPVVVNFRRVIYLSLPTLVSYTVATSFFIMVSVGLEQRREFLMGGKHEIPR